MQSQRSAIDVVGRSGPRFSGDGALLERVAPRPGRLPAWGTRSVRNPCRSAAWLALPLGVAVSATHGQTTTENIDASDAAEVAVVASTHPTCDPADGPCFDPFAHGSPFEGCRTSVLDQGGCHAGEPIATAGMVELAVCMANVRAGFPAPPVLPPPQGNTDIQASAQQNMWCGPSSGDCGINSPIPAMVTYVVANGLTSDDCWNWDISFTGSCLSTCPDSTSASFSDRYQVKNHRDFKSDAEAMAYLENVGPIVAAMQIRDDFMAYNSGVYSFGSGDFLRGNHSVLIYGFGTVDAVDYWRCKNSFGDVWGECGYFKILRGPGNGVNMEFSNFRAAEGIACTTMCGGICGQIRHSVCNGRGTCQTDGECTCDSGFGGSLCERSVVCGDGLVDAGESCDDGNTDDGDGCSSTCTVEPDSTCTGEPSVCITGIPAVSQWGLVAMTLLLLSGGTILLIARRRTTN